MALPLVRLPSLPARQPPLRLPKHSVLPHGGRVSFAAAVACSSGGRAALVACSASASVAPAEAVVEEPEGPRTRLIAQNIPWDFTADDMRALFGKHGSVVDVELSMYNSTRNRGLAFVTMGSEEEALSALNNLNSTTLNDRTIKVDFARSRKKQYVVPPAPMPKHSVFVGNLTWRVRSRHLRELFASTPGVQSVEVVFHTTSPRRSAGYGFVSFSSKEAAEAAISTFNGTKLMGRSINVMFKDDNAKKNKSAAPKEEDLKAESSEQELRVSGQTTKYKSSPRFLPFLAEATVPSATLQATAHLPPPTTLTNHTPKPKPPHPGVDAAADGEQRGRGAQGERRAGRRDGVGAGAGDAADGGGRRRTQEAAAAVAAVVRRRPAPELRPAASREALRPAPHSAKVGERGGGDEPRSEEWRQRRRRRRRPPDAGVAVVAVAGAGGGGEAGGSRREQRRAVGAAGAGLGGAVGAPALGHDTGGREQRTQRSSRSRRLGQGRRRRGGGGGGRRRRSARDRRVVARARRLRRHCRHRARHGQAPLKTNHFFTSC